MENIQWSLTLHHAHTLSELAVTTLAPEDKELWKKLTILDGIEFLHDHILPRLTIQPVDENIVLHPNCSSRKLGLDGKMLRHRKTMRQICDSSAQSWMLCLRR